jgi:uncharacterized protein
MTGETTMAVAKNGVPCWMDLLTSDTERARDFYGQVFGWAAGATAPEFDGYFMFMADGAPVAGCMPVPAAMPVRPGVKGPDAWGTYLTVPDVQATLAAATARGAAVRVPVMAVADLGTQAIITDPGGASIGLWQPETFPGFGPIGTGRPGTPAWFELQSLDYAGSVDFYREVFGWAPQQVSDTDEFRLSVIDDDGQPVAGVMDAAGYLTKADGPRWDVYLSVPDTDKTLALAVELGGQVTQPGTDTPYGRIGAAADPTGAAFKIVSDGT